MQQPSYPPDTVPPPQGVRIDPLMLAAAPELATACATALPVLDSLLHGNEVSREAVSHAYGACLTALRRARRTRG